jgi:hypothetical protein
MDLIKLLSTSSQPTEFSYGKLVEGYTRALWVEKYRGPGEFKLEAPLSSGLMTFLPLGSFVTHKETGAVMIVENHNILQPKDEDPIIIITGRCMTTFLEERIIGDQWAATSNVVQEEGNLADVTWDQAIALIEMHLTDSSEDNDELAGVEAIHTCSGSSTTEARTYRFQDVYRTLIEVLKVDDLGIRVQRPTPTDDTTYFVIYRGNDISKTVRFSWMRGDLDNIEYFFSIKKLKTQARVIGQWVQTIVNPTGATRYNRRTMVVDASDLDEQLDAYPSGGTLTSIISKMQTRGRQALKSQNNVSIVQADVSENSDLRYRRDYNLGDLVTVDGDYGAAAVFRVIEYAEADDETGSSGHPTLAIPGED